MAIQSWDYEMRYDWLSNTGWSMAMQLNLFPVSSLKKNKRLDFFFKDTQWREMCSTPCTKVETLNLGRREYHKRRAKQLIQWQTPRLVQNQAINGEEGGHISQGPRHDQTRCHLGSMVMTSVQTSSTHPLPFAPRIDRHHPSLPSGRAALYSRRWPCWFYCRMKVPVPLCVWLVYT